jgi:hypothetical protein
MSSDKRRRFFRACALLREVNCGRYLPPTLSGGKHKWGMRNPTIRYVVERGMAQIKRVRGTCSRNHTILDTGAPWARRLDRSFDK